MKNKILKFFSLSLATTILFTGCGQANKGLSNNENDLGEDKEIVGEVSQNFGSGETISISEIKAKYLGGSFNEEIAIKPFYNIEQNTEFTFHFNSMVEPCKAITVHTDSKCLESSTVYQINDGYVSDNGGIDVVVKPGKPVLNSSERTNGALDNYNWGNAGIYYLCIRYDMNATTPTLLEEPIIVPFTVKSDVSVPTLTCSISQYGEFELSWLPVKDAVSYNIYQANQVRDTSAAYNMTRAEAGYVGDHLTKLTSVDANTLSFSDFKLDGTNNMLLDSNGRVITQNFYDLGSYYVTAVDANGNESFFSLPVTGWTYENQLPNNFDVYNAFSKDENGYVDTLVGSVTIKMCDGTNASFPINYNKIGEEYGYAIYEYTIVGTKLSGTINYKNDSGIYEEVVLSSVSFNYDNYIIDNQINVIPTNDIDTIIDEDYSNSNVDLSKKVDRDVSKKLQYSSDALLKRADIESARIIYDGVYPENGGLDSIPTYLSNNQGSSSSNTQSSSTGETPSTSTQPPSSGQSTGQAPVDTETPSTPEVTETPNETPIVTEEPSAPEVTEVPSETPVVTEEPSVPEVTEVPSETPIVTEEPSVPEVTETPSEVEENIDSSNLVETQIESTQKQVEESNKTEVAQTNYTIFAENAEQEYLALCMINAQTSIDVSAFPSLQNADTLIDNVLAVVEQNPYILSVTSYGYSYSEQTLYIEYSLTPDEIFSRQSEIQSKASSVISQIIQPSMSEEEKIHAIWKYLEDNTSYDNAALEAAKANGFSASALTDYEDSFNTYGILCKNVGVCSSYGYTFKLLCDVADVDCMRVTGNLNYTLPHAWNVVELNGNWYQLDITNHKNTTGVPYLLYLTSTSYASDNGWVMNKDFVLDSNYNTYITSDNSKEYYESNGLVAHSLEEECQIIARELLNGNTSGAVRCDDPVLDTEDKQKQFVSYLVDNGVSIDTIKSLKFGWNDTLFIYQVN